MPTTHLSDLDPEVHSLCAFSQTLCVENAGFHPGCDLLADGIVRSDVLDAASRLRLGPIDTFLWVNSRIYPLLVHTEMLGDVKGIHADEIAFRVLPLTVAGGRSRDRCSGDAGNLSTCQKTYPTEEKRREGPLT